MGPDDQDRTRQEIIPLVEESLRVDKRVGETGRVRVRTETLEHTGHARADLLHEGVEVTRITIGREVSAVPPTREEGDLLVIPVVEEVMVVEKRLVLREEVHIRRTRRVESIDEAVVLRTQQAIVERDPATPSATTQFTKETIR